jgi:hypothetical protein
LFEKFGWIFLRCFCSACRDTLCTHRSLPL